MKKGYVRKKGHALTSYERTCMCTSENVQKQNEIYIYII